MLYFTTTGISRSELLLLKPHLPTFLEYEPYLTTRTSLLVTYKATFTDKHIQALKWKLPIIHIEWLYDTSKNQKGYEIDIFEGAKFCTSKISNDIFKMYCKFLGGEWMIDMDRSITFLISNESIKDSELKHAYSFSTLDAHNNGTVPGSKSDESTKDSKSGAVLDKMLSATNDASLPDLRSSSESRKENSGLEAVQLSDLSKTTIILDTNAQTIGYTTKWNDNYSEKVLYAHKCRIPIIKPEDIFLNKWEILKHEKSFEAIKKEGSIFSNITFFIDANLPAILFNALKRIIIENSGVRVSKIEDNVDYVITSLKGYDKLLEVSKCEKNKINSDFSGENRKCKTRSDYLEEVPFLHYQYIFDCKETKSLLIYNFYDIKKTSVKKIFENVFCFIDKSLTENKNEISNKIESMGGIIKNSIQNITHYIVKNRKEYLKYNKTNYPFKTVLYDWIDQCLFYGKLVNEEKYLVKINEFEKHNILNKKGKLAPKLNLIKVGQKKGFAKDDCIGKSNIDNKCMNDINVQRMNNEYLNDNGINVVKKGDASIENSNTADKNHFSNAFSHDHSLRFFSNNVKYLQSEIIFQFTGLSSFLKNKIINILKKSNVKFIDSPKFEGCSHLIMGTVNTSEKFMCAISRGCFILIPDFINAYDGSINFNFEKYEWNDKNCKEKNEKKILCSIKNWRIRINESKRYAFFGWNVAFFCNENKQKSLEYLIECGGGSIVSLKEYSYDKYNNDKHSKCVIAENGNDMDRSIECMESKETILKNNEFLKTKNITHVFITKKYLENFNDCANLNTKFLGINYIYEYLFK